MSDCLCGVKDRLTSEQVAVVFVGFISMLVPLFRALIPVLLLSVPVAVIAQEEGSGDDVDVIMLPPIVITAYEGEIPVIDGFTGRDYSGSCEAVWEFARTLNTLMINYHRKLLVDEVKHMNFQLQFSKTFENEINELAESFGLGGYRINRENWFRIERSILSRLTRQPFFKIKSLVAWDWDRLNTMRLQRPDSDYAKDIRFNKEKLRWERRVTTHWRAIYYNDPYNFRGYNEINKQQGLNLDTQMGYHFIDRGLNQRVPPSAFMDVELEYPIFYSDNKPVEEQVRYLQQNFIHNLYHIYDPFSWVVRREVRFRNRFPISFRDHLEEQRIRVSDRNWFTRVLAQFMSDVIILRHQGKDEVYFPKVYQWQLSKIPNYLGYGLDLLNWLPDETREGKQGDMSGDITLNFNHAGDAHFLLLDAHNRYPDTFIDELKTLILGLKDREGRISGRQLIREAIEAISDIPYEQFEIRAHSAQLKELEAYRN